MGRSGGNIKVLEGRESADLAALKDEIGDTALASVSPEFGADAEAPCVFCLSVCVYSVWGFEATIYSCLLIVSALVLLLLRCIREQCCCRR